MKTAFRVLSTFALVAELAACSGDHPSARDAAAERKAVALISEERFTAPPGWQWGHIINAGGARLRYGHAAPTAPAHGVIVIAPGYVSPAEEFFETARGFLKAGYAVWILDRRGQGGSDRWPGMGERAYLTSLSAEARDLHQFAVLVKSRARGAPMFLVGESLGGLIGLDVLNGDGTIFNAAAFSSPAIDFQTGNLPRGAVRVLTAFMSDIGFAGAYAPGQHDWRFNADDGGPQDLAMDDRARALASEGWFVAHPELREGGATNGFVQALFHAADVEEAKGWAAKITTPLLIGMVPDDKIAVPAAMQAACSEMPDCRLVRFPGAKHALFSDSDVTRSRWMTAIIDFFDAHRKNAN
jgi:lysophospholipase